MTPLELSGPFEPAAHDSVRVGVQRRIIASGARLLSADLRTLLVSGKMAAFLS